MAQITVEIQHWLLDTPAAMHQCLEDMSLNDFRGEVRVQPEPTPPEPPEGWVAQPVWAIELNDNKFEDSRPSVQALINTVIVYFGGVLQTMAPADFQTQFGEAP